MHHSRIGNTNNALCCDASFQRPVGVDIRDDNRSFHGVYSAVCFRLRLATHRVRDVPFEPVSQSDKETVLLLIRYGCCGGHRPPFVCTAFCVHRLACGPFNNMTPAVATDRLLCVPPCVCTAFCG